MADTFATVEDLEARWRGLSEQERKRAAVLLEDATDLIKASAPRWQHASLSTLRRVCCAVVKRALQAEQGSADGLPEPRGLLSSEMHVTGPFTDQYAYSNPEGDLFLRAAELKQLGGRRSAAFEVDLLAPAVAP
jgi:hypothetical protein